MARDLGLSTLVLAHLRPASIPPVLVAEADAFWRSGGVLDPARYAALILPGIEM
jgi:hypothetical protein